MSYESCLVSAMFAVSSVSVFQEEPIDLSGVPEACHVLRAVFNKFRASSLPPHLPSRQPASSQRPVLCLVCSQAGGVQEIFIQISSCPYYGLIFLPGQVPVPVFVLGGLFLFLIQSRITQKKAGLSDCYISIY